MILINPPSPFLEDARVFPYLGILHVATDWRKRGHNVRVLDLNGQQTWAEKVTTIKDEVVGLTSTSAQFKYAYEINKILKQNNNFTFIGGAHASAISALRDKGLRDVNTRTLEEFDVVIQGDGENLYVDKNYGIQAKWIKSPLVDVKSQDMPDRDFININSYHYQIDGKKATTIMTQRGCPFKCEFCSGRDMDMYRKPRQRDPKQVVKEMDTLNWKYGHEAFMWYDDEININPRRLGELCDLLAERPYKHRGFIRSDLLVRHPETLESMVRAGFVELCSGVESGSERILKLINKGTTVNQCVQAAEMIKGHGIRYKAFTIIGHPSETYEDAMKTKELIKMIKPDSFDVTVLTPYPGSKIYDEVVESSKFPGYDFEHKGLYFNRPDFSKDEAFYKGKKNREHPVFTRTDELTGKDIYTLRKELLSCA